MSLYLFGALIPVLLSLLIRTSKSKKPRGVPVDVGGERGIALRNSRYTSPLETVWKDVSTLAELFEQSCMKFPNRHLLGSRKLISKETEISEDGRAFEKLHLGEYEWLTYSQVLEAVQSFSSGLVRLGHARDEHVAIISDTRFEWFLTLQGCFRRNVTVVTIYASLGDEALYHSLNQTEVSTIICGQKELKKLIAVGGRLNSVKRVICMNDDISPISTSDRRSGRWEVLTFDHVMKLGRDHPSDPDLPISSDIAVIMYTSGSTGMPKGVMMTHCNLLATVSAVRTIIPRLGSRDVYLAYLPLAHVLELVADVCGNLITSVGSAIGYGTPLTLTDASSKVKKGTKGDASALRPTLMAAVPAILDRVRGSVHKMVENKGGIRKKLFDLAYARKLSALNGRWYGGSTLENFLWYFFVFRKVGAILGGRIRLVLSGGAPLSADTQRFINICFGVPIGQGYGLTETCAGGTFSEFDDMSVGSVGPPLPCSYIKLVDWVEGGYRTSDKPMPRGEVTIGGPCVTVGYFKNEEKTRGAYEVDERGMRWFRTEDIGQIRSDGCLQIIDRKKDIVKLQHGEYVSLGKVEAVLCRSPYVDNVMVHADPSSSYCVALIVASRPALESWASSQGTTHADFSHLCANPEALKQVYSSLLKAAKEAGLERFEIPAKVKLLADGWTQESGLVSVSMKLKRDAVRKAFSNELSHLYAS